MDTHWSPTTKYIVAVGMVLAGIGVLYISRPILGFVILAGILAFLTYPIVRYLNRRLRFPRGLATITAYLLLGLVLALVPVILTPVAIDAVSAINVNTFVNWLQARAIGLESWLVSVRAVEAYQYQVSLAPVVDPILDFLAGTTPNELPSLERLLGLIPSALGSVTDLAGYLAGIISSFALAIFLTVVTSVYLSIDSARFYRGFMEMVPAAYQEELRTLLGSVARVWSAYFRGQITVSLILALMTWVGATAIGLPAAFLLGIAAGVLALIPNLGPILSFIPAVIVALVQGSTYLPLSNLTFALVVALLYLIIQQLEGNLITPRIVGQAVDLPPVLVLLGVAVGASTAGLLGAVLAAPVLATGRVLTIYAWNKLTDRDPFCQLELERPEPKQLDLRPLVRAVRSAYWRARDRSRRLLSTLARPARTDEEE